MDAEIIAAAVAEAEDSGRPIADLPLDRIARRAGVSRSTLFRRIRDRQALEAALRAAGIDPGHRPGVRDRAVRAATDLILAEGIGALTVEAVARRAGCATTSVHTQFGGRDGLLAAVFERYAPLPVVERMMAAGEQPEAFQFQDTVRAVYTAVFDAVAANAVVAEAFLVEALARPDGQVMRLARGQVAPRVARTIGGWLTAEIRAGRCRDLPLPVLIPLLIAPISVHLLTRKYLTVAGVPVPDRETVIETMTEAFCRAVGTNTKP